MRPVVANVSDSTLMSVQLALTAHGIRHTGYREYVEGVRRYANCVMVDDEDFESATALVRSLQTTSPYAGLWDRTAFRLFAAVAALATVGGIIALLVAHRA